MHCDAYSRNILYVFHREDVCQKLRVVMISHWYNVDVSLLVKSLISAIGVDQQRFVFGTVPDVG